MCLAVFTPQIQMLNITRLHAAYNANPDGCGVAWTFNNKLHIMKGLFDFKDFACLLSCLPLDAPALVHFRTASSGSLSDRACHPLWVSDDLVFVLNGNLFEFSSYFTFWKDSLEMTDAQRFNSMVLKRLPKDFLHNTNITKLLGAYFTDNHSKAIFLDSSGHATIFNEVSGQWKDGIFYSNGGISGPYTGYGYSGAYTYHENETRHKGGMILVQMLPRSRRSQWRQCHVCKGYYKSLQTDTCSSCNLFIRLMELTE